MRFLYLLDDFLSDQLDYNILKVNYELSTGLYLELIEKLNMENEFRKLLYSIPQLVINDFAKLFNLVYLKSL